MFSIREAVRRGISAGIAGEEGPGPPRRPISVDLGLGGVLLDPEEDLEHEVGAAQLRQLVGCKRGILDVQRGAGLGTVEIEGDLAAPFLRPAVIEGAPKLGKALGLGDADAETCLARNRTG